MHDWLSLNMGLDSSCFRPNSLSNLRRYMTFLEASVRTLYSDLIVDRDTVG